MEANAGEYIKKYLHLKRFRPRISLHCKLVPVQYREYEYGLFKMVDHSDKTNRTKKQSRRTGRQTDQSLRQNS